MTADIEMLPLPEELACEYRLLSRTGLREAVEAYARAVAEHNVKAQGAEIETLRAVLCDPSGRVCVTGTDADRAEVQKALDTLDAAIASLSAPQPPAEAHCATCSCVPGMTPAVRFDTTPAEKEGAVRDHLIRMGWTPPAEAQPVPPSAPVGVEGLIAEWKMLIAHPDTSTIMRATLENVVIRLQHTLAQQPAVVDGDDFDCPHSAFDNCDCYADQQGDT